MNVRIYICTHRHFDMPPAAEAQPSVYIPLQVGAALNEDLGITRDDSGDNISRLNPLFGELTGLYWVWKNDGGADIVGICHYRRYFALPDGSIPSAADFEQRICADGADIITSDMPVSHEPPRQAYGEAHEIHDLEACGRSLMKLFPDYTETFREVLDTPGQGMCYGNLIAAKKETFDAYCSWLFPVLFDASEEIDVSGRDLYHRRVYGFLSEILLNVWIREQKKRGMRICPARILCTDEKSETVELKRAVGQLLKSGRLDEALTMYTEFIRLRPDVLLPMSDIRGDLAATGQILCILRDENAKISRSADSRTSDDANAAAGTVNAGNTAPAYDLPALLTDYRYICRILMQMSDEGENYSGQLPSSPLFTETGIRVILENAPWKRLGADTAPNPDRIREALACAGTESHRQ